MNELNKTNHADQATFVKAKLAEIKPRESISMRNDVDYLMYAKVILLQFLDDDLKQYKSYIGTLKYNQVMNSVTPQSELYW